MLYYYCINVKCKVDYSDAAATTNTTLTQPHRTL